MSEELGKLSNIWLILVCIFNFTFWYVRVKRLACVSFQKSFLFDKRPLSPEINAFKQEEYSQTLLKQMESKREKEIKQRQNRELMDRLEQVQLTEE